MRSFLRIIKYLYEYRDSILNSTNRIYVLLLICICGHVCDGCSSNSNKNNIDLIITPNKVQAGTITELKISTDETDILNSESEFELTPGDGISLGKTRNIDGLNVLVEVKVEPLAHIGKRIISLKNGKIHGSGTISIYREDEKKASIIFDPPLAKRGESTKIAVVGKNTNFVAGKSAIVFADAKGLKISDLNVFAVVKRR